MRTLLEVGRDARDRWQIVNDGVMGGLSRSRITRDDSGATFEGEVSLANGGGFASVRTSLETTDLSGWDGIAVRVEGGGLTFQLRLHAGEAEGISYRARFTAPPDRVRTVRVPFSAFEATWRGRPLPHAEPLDLSRISRIGFLVADGHSGPFRLRIESIRAYRETGLEEGTARERRGDGAAPERFVRTIAQDRWRRLRA
jgi:monofunctional biosynthetic peptidoglycan transglycosylase